MAKSRSKSVVAEPVQLEQLLDIPEVATTLKLGRKMVYRLIREEGLPTVTFGYRRLVIPSELAAWVKQRSRAGM